MKKISVLVVDLEFLGHTPESVVTGVGYALGEMEFGEDGFHLEVVESDGVRVNDANLKVQYDAGRTTDPDTVKWAEENGMDKILKQLSGDTGELTRILGKICSHSIHVDWICERSVGADIPKLDSLAELMLGSGEIGSRYWYKIKEVRSLLDGTTLFSPAFKHWPEEMTKHNPHHDALVDLEKILYAFAYRMLSLEDAKLVDRAATWEDTKRAIEELGGL